MSQEQGQIKEHDSYVILAAHAHTSLHEKKLGLADHCVDMDIELHDLGLVRGNHRLFL